MAMQEISDETRVIEPVGVVKPMPLDVPRVNGFRQGYEPAAAERLVADLKGRLATQTRFADEYRSALDKARGDIRGAEARIDDLKHQVAELRHTADSPFEAAGKAGQALLDAARAQGAKALEESKARAKAITDDMDARYTAFAKAEAFLLDHAFAIPFSISNRSYQMCNLNVFEGQYASFGVANQRYKDQHLYSTSMGLEEYQAAYAEWQSKVAG